VVSEPPGISDCRSACVRLAYRVSDDVRVERARITVSAGRRSMTVSRRIGVDAASRSVSWRAPKRRGTYRSCIEAWDNNGQASPRRCATVRVR
jgi:hypothetical protein